MTDLEGPVTIYRFMDNLNHFLADKLDLDLALQGVFKSSNSG